MGEWKCSNVKCKQSEDRVTQVLVFHLLIKSIKYSTAFRDLNKPLHQSWWKSDNLPRTCVPCGRRTQWTPGKQLIIRFKYMHWDVLPVKRSVFLWIQFWDLFVCEAEEPARWPYYFLLQLSNTVRSPTHCGPVIGHRRSSSRQMRSPLWSSLLLACSLSALLHTAPSAAPPSPSPRFLGDCRWLIPTKSKH